MKTWLKKRFQLTIRITSYYSKKQSYVLEYVSTIHAWNDFRSGQRPLHKTHAPSLRKHFTKYRHRRARSARWPQTLEQPPLHCVISCNDRASLPIPNVVSLMRPWILGYTFKISQLSTRCTIARSNSGHGDTCIHYFHEKTSLHLRSRGATAVTFGQARPFGFPLRLWQGAWSCGATAVTATLVNTFEISTSYIPKLSVRSQE